MAEKKSIIEEALLDVKKIQSALNANTKEILRSVAREEIDGLVKESLTENDFEEETVDGDDEGEIGGDATESPIGDEGGEAADAGIEDIGGDQTDDSAIQTPDEVGADQEFGTDADALGGDELDMTDASDDDVIAIYKKLSGEDEIEVVGDEIHMTITEPGDYIVKTNDAAAAEAPIGDEAIGGEEFGTDDSVDGADDEMSYEIAMDDDDETPEGEESPESTESPIGDEGGEEAESTDDEENNDEPIAENETPEEGDEDMVKEAIPVGTAQAHRLPGKAKIGQPLGAGADNLKESASAKKIINEAEVKYNKLLTEANKLKSQNTEYKEALKTFRNMLVETVVFNSNLSYITKLFMEHATTKDEKKKFIQRFDEEVRTLEQSKRLYKTIVNELKAKKPVNESVENKIIKEVTTGSSKQLNEATAYADPSTQRIKDLINRVENKDKF